MLENKNTILGFDNKKYIKLQSEKINERIKAFDGRLYMEFGGKILKDSHAGRVLPGFDPRAKTEILKKFKGKAEIIFCINAQDIEKRKINSNNGTSYEIELLHLVDEFEELGIPTVAIVITQYDGQIAAEKFKKQLERRGLKAYFHTFTKGYPTDVDTIVSDEGYGAQPYIKTTKPLVIVSAPGPNSGKLATCLAQMYHEYKRGEKAGYAKFETFPVWNLSLKHSVNMAYEAATADIGDVNMIDNFHLEEYGETAVSYNRDLAVFPILKNILYKIVGKDIYHSPTDMGVNVVGECIVDEIAIREADNNEIIRRYLNSLCDYKNGIYDIEVPNRIKVLMDEAEINVDDRKVVSTALAAKKEKGSNVVAIELPNGDIVTGKDTGEMTAPAAAVVNALKELGNIKDSIHLISPVNLTPMKKLKKNVYGEAELNLPDVLMALAVSEAINPTVELALSNVYQLKGSEAHSTVMLSKTELDSLKKLGVNITCTDEFV